MSPRAALIVAILGVVSGCYTWSATEIPATEGPWPGNPKYLHVTRSDGTAVSLTHPVVSADSVFGSTYIRGQGTVRLAIPKTDIRNLSASTFSGTRTAGAVIGATAGALVALYIALSNSSIGPGCQPAIC